jgi:hypothetical protein
MAKRQSKKRDFNMLYSIDLWFLRWVMTYYECQVDKWYVSLQTCKCIIVML